METYNISNQELFFPEADDPLLNRTTRPRIRVVWAKNPPDAFDNCVHFPSLMRTNHCPFPGWTTEIFSMILDATGYDVDIVRVNNVVGSLDWGTLQANGTWTGVLGYLANGTADSAALFYQVTETRDTYFDFTYPVTNIQPIFTVKRKVASIGSVMWNAIKPYQLPVWFCILGSFITYVTAMYLIARVEASMKRRRHTSPFQWLWYATELQFDERSDEMQFHTVGGNITLFFFALLQSAFFKYLYEATLLTSLLQHGDQNPFQDADSMIALIAKGQYHLTTNYIGNWYFDDLAHSNDPHFVSLRKATANNPVVVTNSVKASLDLVELGNYIYPIQEDSIAMQMSKLRCNLVYVSQGMPQQSANLVFNNNSKFLKDINLQVVMQQTFVQRTYRKYFQLGYKLQPLPKCDTSKFDQDPAHLSLDIQSAIGIFMVYGIMLAISVATFFIEIYVFWHYRLIRLRRRAGLTPDEAFNLIQIAKIHFTTDNSENLALFTLLEAKRSAAERRRSSTKSI